MIILIDPNVLIKYNKQNKVNLDAESIERYELISKFRLIRDAYNAERFDLRKKYQPELIRILNKLNSLNK